MSNFISFRKENHVTQLALGLAFAVVLVAAFSFWSSAEAEGKNKKRTLVREVGLMNFAAEGECADDIPNSIRGNDYTEGLDFKFGGALEGCIYTYVDLETAGCTERGDGTFSYYEEGNELFVGTFQDDANIDGRTGTLITKYWFEATYPTLEDCEGFTNQIDGGCVHRFINGTGTGVFKGARGEYSVIDNVVDGVAINFPYILDLKVRR